MTVTQALDVRQRSISAREAEIFLQEALQVERSWLHAHPEATLTADQEERFEGYLRLREQNWPVAYIIGHKEFYGRPFHTDQRALIPRPESEGMIDLALAWLRRRFAEKVKASNRPCPLHILELGTGCGNLAVTLALELAASGTPASLTATDLSAEALELAQENWQQLGAQPGFSRLTFLQADLFRHEQIQGPYDLIIANLPYVPTTWRQDPAAQPEVVFHEPDLALFGGEDGLELYRRFFAEAPAYLSNPGYLLVEFGETETAEIISLARHAFPTARITVHQDYAQLDRILSLEQATD